MTVDPTSSGRTRILLADDDRDIRELITFKLTSSGFEVTTADNGGAALQLARREAFGLVVLDVMMPEMTGVEVCRALRATPETAEVPVILLTAKAQDADLETGMSAGADDYITKPFSPRELVGRIEALLRR